MKVLLVVSCVLVLVGGAGSQTVTVVDQSTLQPLEHAGLFANRPHAAAYTDDEGRADIAAFQPADSILIRHLGYHTLLLSYREIEERGFIVHLAERTRALDEVVASANRWEQSLHDVPHQILKTRPSDIVFANPATTAEVLANTGEVFVQKSQLGGGSPMLRGHAANAVLMVFDGVRMNNAIYRSGNLQNIISVDANFLERAEVLFGPGSVLYGSDAMGGVMVFQSRNPRPSHMSSLHAFTGAFSRYASASREKTQHVNLGLGYQDFGSFTSFTYSDFCDLRSGARRKSYDPEFGKRAVYVERVNDRDTVLRNDDVNVQRGSAYTQWNLLQKFLYQPAAALDFQYSLNLTSSSNIPRYDRLVESDNAGAPRFAAWYYGPQKWAMHSLTTSLRSPNALFTHGRLIVAFQTLEESRHDRRLNNDQLRSQTERVDVLSANIDCARIMTQSTELDYGLELVHNDVVSTAQRENIVTRVLTRAATRYPDGGSSVFSFSAYGHLKHVLSEYTTFTAGARYSRVHLDAELLDTSFFAFPFRTIGIRTGALTGSLGLVYHPAPDWKLHLSASSGFRAPNVDDIGKIFESAPGVVVVPDDRLGPEFSYTVETGAGSSFRNGLSFSVIGYYSWLVDVHVRRNTRYNGQDSILYDGVLSQVVSNVNAGRAYVAGLTVTAGMDITPGFSVRSTITYTAGRDQIEDLPLRHVPPVFGRTSMVFQGDRYRIEAFADYNAWRHFEDLAPEEQAKTFIYSSAGSPGWATLNLRGSLQVVEQLQLTAAIENILDVHYRPYSSGISAPGRNVIAALHVRI